MTSPVSIGDALLLCKLAFKLGQTFTSGRKSAPAEFREVENQLYSLSTALSSLHSSRIADHLNTGLGGDAALTADLEDGQDGSAMLNKMLEGCRETLSHLERIVEDYASLKKSTETEMAGFKRWGKRLATDFKKIKWTTEGGDLATLRGQLMVHINCINVVLGVVNNVQIGRVEDSLASAVTLLKEIREYAVHGLHSAVADKGKTQSVRQHLPWTGSFFELYTTTDTSTEPLCYHALLDPDWTKQSPWWARGGMKSTGNLFICGCTCTPESSLPPHAMRLSSLSLAPLSFAIRLVDQELSWMLYKIADRDTGRQVSVVIRKLSPIYMLDFQELFAHELSISRAKAWLRQGMGTTLAFAEANSEGEQEAHVLNLLADLSATVSSVEDVTISLGRLTYSRADIDDIEITHYSACKLESFLSSTSERSLLRPQTFAEIVIHYRGDSMSLDEDVTRTKLRLEYNSRFEYHDGDTQVTLLDVHCTSVSAHGEKSGLRSGKVVVTFSAQTAARMFKQKIVQMCAELSLISLRFPRSEEVVVMKLQAGGVHTEEIAMAEADIVVVQETTNKLFRLIITSHDGRTVMSQKLSSDFMGDGISQSNFRSLTWVAHTEENGRNRIRRCRNGFNHIVLSDVCTNNLFQGWMRSRLWQHSLPFRNLPLLHGKDD